MKILMGLAMIVCCALIGAFWAFALNGSVFTGLTVGSILGIPIGLYTGFLLKTISTMSNTASKAIATIAILPTIFLFLLSGIGIELMI